MAEVIDEQQYYHRLSLPDLKVVTDVVSAVKQTIINTTGNRSNVDIDPDNPGWVGVYAIGSYAREEQDEHSDVDLLVAHNVWFSSGGFTTDSIWGESSRIKSREGFTRVLNNDRIAIAALEAIVIDFPKRLPSKITGELPSQYEEGDPQRKIMARFVGPIAGRSALDLVCFRGRQAYVVDENERVAEVIKPVDSLEEFLNTIDVSPDGSPLTRIPLFEWSPGEGINLDLSTNVEGSSYRKPRYR